MMRQSVLLFLTAVIWGVAFVAQKEGMDYVGPFTYNGVRSILGGLVLLPCILLLDKVRGGVEENDGKIQEKKELIIGGLCCGVILFAASSLQQLGIQYTSVGKAGFITAMYILLVPIMGLFIHRKVGIKVWVGVVFAVCGLYLLCMGGGLRLERGDALVLMCALIFSLHILVIDYFTPKVDGVRMSCIQFWVCGILSMICCFLFEEPEFHSILAAWKPVCYGGIMSCGVAYTLQIVGQKGMNPTVASLILSMESVVSVIAAFLIRHEELSRRQLMGCCFMFVAIVLAQLPERSRISKISIERNTGSSTDKD